MDIAWLKGDLVQNYAVSAERTQYRQILNCIFQPASRRFVNRKMYACPQTSDFNPHFADGHYFWFVDLMISVSVASGNEDDRKTIVSLLSQHDDFQIVSAGKDGYDVLKSAKTHQPDIVITDFSLSDIAGSHLAPIVRLHSPSTEFIVLCSPAEAGTFYQAMKAGISGYLLKPDDFANLVSAVRCVFYGGLYVCSREKCRLLQSADKFNPCGKTNRTPQVPPECFSPTESRILNGIVLGYNDREIAEQLRITTGALRNNVNRVKQKTGLHNRTQLSFYAMLCGIINLDEIRELFEAVPKLNH